MSAQNQAFVEGEGKNKRHSALNSMIGLRDCPIDRHVQSLDRSTEVARETETQLGRSTGRSIDISSKSVMPEDLTRSTERLTAHLGQSTGRSTNSRVRMNSGLDLELFCGSLLFPINRGNNPF